MVLLVRDGRDSVDEFHGTVEIAAVEAFFERVAAVVPIGKRFQPARDLVVTQYVHIVPFRCSSASTASKASSVRSISAPPCSVERNINSFGEGARRIPRSRIA